MSTSEASVNLWHSCFSNLYAAATNIPENLDVEESFDFHFGIYWTSLYFGNGIFKLISKLNISVVFEVVFFGDTRRILLWNEYVLDRFKKVDSLQWIKSACKSTQFTYFQCFWKILRTDLGIKNKNKMNRNEIILNEISDKRPVVIN
jgi:hypothetical protein